jgi:hypothetical protein
MAAGTSGEVFWLQVRSTPPGAFVIIDGQAEGRTPFQRRIFDSGRSYKITLNKPGFESFERTVGAGDDWVRSGNTRTLTVTTTLKAAPGAATEAGEPKPEPKAAEPKATEPPAAKPPVERKANPFDEPTGSGQ